MKNFFLTISMVFFPSTVKLETEQTNLKMIKRTLNYYLEGLVNNDVAKLEKAFNSSATMKWIDTNYRDVNAVETLSKGLESFPRENIKTHIVSIDIAGNASSAKLQLELPDFIFIDFIHLLKINEEWKIVSKTYYKKNK